MEENNQENKIVEGPSVSLEPKHPRKRFKKVLSFTWDFVKIAIIAFIIVAPIRYFLFQPFIVSGLSMAPSFASGDYLIVDEISYRFSEPQRGDIVVFKLKNKDYNEYLIKRIIGLPGETVVIKDGKVIIKNEENKDGYILKENYLPEERLTNGELEESVPLNSYFVLGDNRGVSYDSRLFGFIEKDKLTGKVLFRGLPIERAGLIEMGRY